MTTYNRKNMVLESHGTSVLEKSIFLAILTNYNCNEDIHNRLK